MPTYLELRVDVEARTEEVEGQGEVVVVDQARVDGEGAHQENHVAGRVQRLKLGWLWTLSVSMGQRMTDNGQSKGICKM